MSQSILKVRMNVDSMGMPAELLSGYWVKRLKKGGFVKRKKYYINVDSVINIQIKPIHSKSWKNQTVAVSIAGLGSLSCSRGRGSHKLTILFHEGLERCFCSSGCWKENFSGTFPEGESWPWAKLSWLCPTNAAPPRQWSLLHSSSSQTSKPTSQHPPAKSCPFCCFHPSDHQQNLGRHQTHCKQPGLVEGGPSSKEKVFKIPSNPKLSIILWFSWWPCN